MGIIERGYPGKGAGVLPYAGPSKAVEVDPEVAPPLPEVAWTILEFTTDLCCGVVQLEALIRRDQTLTSGIMRMANSAYFGLARKVDSIRQAAVILGNKRLRNLAVTVSLGGVLQNTAFGRSLWEHSLGVAIAASALADVIGYTDKDKAFLAGILHDIGKSALNNQHQEMFIESIQLAAREGISAVEAERRVMGTDHCLVGAMLANHWNLPTSLEEAVELHHEPLSALEDPDLACLINLADGLCLKMGISCSDRSKLDLTQLESWGSLGIDEDQIAQVSEEVTSALERDKGFFGLA